MFSYLPLYHLKFTLSVRDVTGSGSLEEVLEVIKAWEKKWFRMQYTLPCWNDFPSPSSGGSLALNETVHLAAAHALPCATGGAGRRGKWSRKAMTKATDPLLKEFASSHALTSTAWDSKVRGTWTCWAFSTLKFLCGGWTLILVIFFNSSSLTSSMWWINSENKTHFKKIKILTLSTNERIFSWLLSSKMYSINSLINHQF